MNWLRRLLGLCEHKWAIHERQDVFDFALSKKIPAHTDFYLRCEHCGEMKRKRL